MTDKNYDKFGIEMLYPSLFLGREWYSPFDKGNPRMFSQNAVPDAESSELFQTGNTECRIGGASGGVVTDTITLDTSYTYKDDSFIPAGEAKLRGSAPRLYVKDTTSSNDPSTGTTQPGYKVWYNTEITYYFWLNDYYNVSSSIGFTSVTRTNHYPDDFDDGTRGYGVKNGYDASGRVLVDRECNHHTTYANKQSEPTYPRGYGNRIPFKQWIGVKQITRDTLDGNVHIEVYLDMTDGLGGGVWNKVHDFYDYNGWSADADINTESLRGLVLNDPSHLYCPSTYIRTDYITGNDGKSADKNRYVKIKKWSIREIKAEPKNSIIQKRYLWTQDFPNTTNLYGYRLPVQVYDYPISVVGGVSLSKQGNGFTLATYDPTQSINTCICGVDADGDSAGSDNASLQLTASQDVSYCFWAKTTNWAAESIDFMTWDTTNDLTLELDTTALRLKLSGSTTQVSCTHGLTGSGWHFFAITRDVSNTKSCIYIDGELAASADVATALGGTTTYLLLSYGSRLYLQDIWIHKDTVWTAEQQKALYLKGAGLGNYLDI